MIFSVFQKNQVLGYSWSTQLWLRCYYPHRSRDALSPVRGIFIFWQGGRLLKQIVIHSDKEWGSTNKNMQIGKIIMFFSMHMKNFDPTLKAFYKSKCPSVCPCVRVFVRLSVCSLLRYRLNVFLPQLPEVGFQIFLEIRNPWVKSNGKKWPQIGTF